MLVRLKREVLCATLIMGAFGLSCAVAVAQYAGPGVTSLTGTSSAPASALSPEYSDIRIMPGDVISINTYGAPELTINAQTSAGTLFNGNAAMVDGLKVGPQGEVVLPYLGAVKVSGMMPSEASVFLSKALKDGGFLVDPQVSVALVESPSRVITVIGEVLKPSPVPAFGQVRLLDAISACGGFTPMASHSITIRRLGNPDPIAVELGTDPRASSLGDIPLLPGDTVIVPRVGNVYVVGEVKTEEAIPLSNNAPITVMRAVTIAGGLKYSAALSKARIIRTTADNRRIEIMLDMKKVMYGKQQDVTLLADDILYIPSSTFKATLSAGGASVLAQTMYGIAYIAK